MRKNDFVFRGLSGGIWRYGEYVPKIECMGIKGPAICVHKKEIYFVENPDTISLYSRKEDKRGKQIYQGDILENCSGLRFEVRFGKYAMYCPIDDCMMENVGFYVVAEGYYEDMPLGPTEEYATKIGNVYDNPELKVSK